MKTPSFSVMLCQSEFLLTLSKNSIASSFFCFRPNSSNLLLFKENLFFDTELTMKINSCNVVSSLNPHPSNIVIQKLSTLFEATSNGSTTFTYSTPTYQTPTYQTATYLDIHLPMTFTYL